MEAQSLAEVRETIDGLDRAIVGRMAERGGFVEQAARFKGSHAEVEAPSRVEEVIGKVRGMAAEAGLAPEVVEAAHRAMIAAFIAVEHRVFDGARIG